MDSLDRLCDELKNIKDENESKRLVAQEEKANCEQNIVQEVRDLIEVINKDVSDMVDEYWRDPQATGFVMK
ncbi:hypothetical protein Aduo_010487 [Ancylostoma duodenale]